MVVSVYITQEKMLNIFKCQICVIEQLRADSHPCQTSKMQCFEKIGNCINSLSASVAII